MSRVDIGLQLTQIPHPLRISAGFAKLVDQDIILARLIPCVRELAVDNSQHVRAALGTQISGLAPLLGKEATIEHLLPLFLQLLKDEFPDVRLNIISKLEQVNEGEEHLRIKQRSRTACTDRPSLSPLLQSLASSFSLSPSFQPSSN